MKCLLALLLILPLTAKAQDPLPSPNQVAHIGVGYMITDIMVKKGYSKTQAFWTVFALSTLKEAYDRKTLNEDYAHCWNDVGQYMLGSVSAMWTFELKAKPVRW